MELHLCSMHLMRLLWPSFILTIKCSIQPLEPVNKQWRRRSLFFHLSVNTLFIAKALPLSCPSFSLSPSPQIPTFSLHAPLHLHRPRRIPKWGQPRFYPLRLQPLHHRRRQRRGPSRSLGHQLWRFCRHLRVSFLHYLLWNHWRCRWNVSFWFLLFFHFRFYWTRVCQCGGQWKSVSCFRRLVRKVRANQAFFSFPCQLSLLI